MAINITIPGINETYHNFGDAANAWYQRIDVVLDEGFDESRLAGANWVFTFAGPPRWYTTYTQQLGTGAPQNFNLKGLGILQSITEGEGLQSATIGGIGTSVRLTITGVSSGTINLNKLISTSSNTLFNLYWHYWDPTNSRFVKKDVNDPSQWENAGELMTELTPVAAPDEEAKRYPHLLGLWQKIFKFPVGIAMIMADAEGTIIRKLYFEMCMVQNRGTGVNAADIVLNEGVSLTYQRVIPIATEPGSE